MAPLEDYIFNTFAAEINSGKGAWVQDVYALGFLIYLEDQDLRLPTVGLVYNTNQQWEKCNASVLSKFTGSMKTEQLEGIREETKWLFDYWLQHDLWVRNELPMVAKSCYGPYLDPEGTLLRRAWIDSLNLWYTDEEENSNFDRTLAMGGQIADLFDAHCVRVAQRLHSEGIVKARFGRSIPIVFHAPEHDAVLAWCARDANPPGLAEGFEQYVLKRSNTEFLSGLARNYEKARQAAALAGAASVLGEGANARREWDRGEDARGGF